MKKIKLLIFIAALVGFMAASCTRDITEATLSDSPTAPTASDLTYTAAFNVNNSDSLVTFSWSAADFGFQSSTTYVVQFSSTSDFTSNVANIITTQNLTGKAKIGDINALMLSWNLNIGTAYTVYYRVATTINSSVPTVYSATKSRSFTPFDAVINYPMLYVPGSYQGWSPGATNGRLFSYGFNTTYSCIITLNDFTNPTTDFKIAPAANWNNSWGCNLTKTGNNYSGTLDPSGGNMTVTAGTYIVTVNTSTMAITLTKTDIWGIIGDGVPVTGWNSDQKMFYNGQRKMWEITITLQVGTIKFRANSDWGLNYGSNAGDGNLQQGGANIPITSAGNYLVRFSTEKMIYTLHKN